MQLNNINWSDVNSNAQKNAKRNQSGSDIQSLAHVLECDVNVTGRTIDMVQQWTIEQLSLQIRDNINRDVILNYCANYAHEAGNTGSFANRLLSNTGQQLFEKLIVTDDNPIETISIITKAPKEVVTRCIHASVEPSLAALGTELNRIEEQGDVQFENAPKSEEEYSSEDSLDQIFGEPLPLINKRPPVINTPQAAGRTNAPVNSIDATQAPTKNEPNEPTNRQIKYLNNTDQSTRDGSAGKMSFLHNHTDAEDSVKDRASSEVALDEPSYSDHVTQEKSVTEGFGLRNIAILALTVLAIALLVGPKFLGKSPSAMIGLNEPIVNGGPAVTTVDEDESTYSNYLAGEDVEVDGLDAQPNDHTDPLGTDRQIFASEAKKIRRDINRRLYEENPDLAPKPPADLSVEEITQLSLDPQLNIPSVTWGNSPF